MLKDIFKQGSYFFLAQIVTKGISFIYVIFLARNLGVSDFGLYTVALSYFAILSALSDLGFNRFLIREVSRDNSVASELLSNILILRLALTSVLFAFFAAALYFLDPSSMRVAVTLLGTLAIVPQTAAFTFDAIFVSFRKLQFSALGFFVLSVFTVLFGYILVTGGAGVFGAAIALTAGQLVYVFFLFFLLRKKLTFQAVKINIFKKALAGSLPYGILGVLALLYFKIDTVLLSYMKGSFDTGIYGAAYKFLEAIVFMPGAFAVALFPRMAQLHDENMHELKKLYFKSLKLMFFLGVLVEVIYVLILPFIIRQFLPSYAQAVAAVQVLSLSIPFIFVASVGVQVLFSSDKYLKSVIFLSLFTVAFNIVLNLVFIPEYGYMAAAWITVLSDILSFMIFYLLITRKVFHEKV